MSEEDLGGDEAQRFMEEQQKKKEEKLQDEFAEYEAARKAEKEAMEAEIADMKRKKIERAKEREEDEKRLAAQRREEDQRRKAEDEERKKKKAEEDEKRKKERERKKRENERMKERSKGPNFTIVKKEGEPKKVEDEEKKPPKKTKEQLEKEKQAAISTRMAPFNEELEGTEALANYAKELHSQIRNLVSSMYTLEDTYKRHQYDIVELQERAKAMSKTKKVTSVQYDDSYDRMNDKWSNAPPKVLVANKYEGKLDRRTWQERLDCYNKPKVMLCSKYERFTDGRSFGERHKLYEQLTASVRAELEREERIRAGERVLVNGNVEDNLSGDMVDE